MLIWYGKRDAESGRRKLTVGYSIGNYLDRKAFGIADRFISSLAVTHYAGKLQSLSNPAAVFLPIQLDRQVHFFSIPANAKFTLLSSSFSVHRN